MSNSIIRSWNGRTIRQREDGYLSLTDMAQSTGKKLNDWLRLGSTTEYLNALETDTGIPVTALIQVLRGGNDQKNQGTWGHRLVALEMSRWVSAPFAIQCNKWVEELLLTGRVTLDEANFERQRKLIGSWQQERESGKADRLSFNDVCFKHNPSNPKYAHYTDMVYKCLLGTTANKLRSLPVVEGIVKIGRNHIPESVQIAAVARAEELTVDLYQGDIKAGRKPSLTSAIHLACMTVQGSLDLPSLESRSSKATAQYALIEARSFNPPALSDVDMSGVTIDSFDDDDDF